MKKTYKNRKWTAPTAQIKWKWQPGRRGVKDATVNFMTLKMIVEFEEGQDPKTVMKEVRKNCRKVEDDCEVYI